MSRGRERVPSLLSPGHVPHMGQVKPCPGRGQRALLQPGGSCCCWERESSRVHENQGPQMGGKVVSLEGMPGTLSATITVQNDNAEQPALGLLGVGVWNDCPGPGVLSGR